MAKLTAIFDMQDKITAKLKKMHGNLEKIEKSRKTINQPMTITVRDRATKNLQRLHNFVRKDIAKKHDLVLGLSDQATKSLKAFNRFVERRMPKTYNLMITARDNASNQLKSVNDYLKRRMPKTYEMVIHARDRSRTVLERIRKSLLGNILGTHMFTVMARDRATPTIHNIANYGRRLLGRGYNFTVQAFDKATRTVGRISSYLGTAIPAYKNFSLNALDRATSTIGRVKNALFSIPSSITVALSVIGAKNLLEATVGAAAQMELSQVQVTSLFGENQEAAQKFFDFLNKAGANSMFSQEDFFGSGRAFVPLTKNLDELEYAVKITERLAASNPLEGMEGASFSIREALSGDMVSLAERFNLPKTMLQSIKEAPNLQKKLEALDKLLSDMGYSQEYLTRVNETGYVRWQKLIDSTKLKFTEFGKEGLEASKPLLDDLTRIVNGKGFEQFGKFISDGIKWSVEKAREALGKLEEYFTNPEFQNLDFEGKVNFIMDDLGEWWDKTGRPWLADVAKDVGSAFFKGIVWGVKEGIKGIGDMWADAFRNPSLEGFSGAGIATIIATSLGSLVLAPLIKGISGIYKAGKWFWDRGKDVTNFFGKGKGPKGPTPPVTGGSGKTPTTAGQPKGGFFANLFGKRGKAPVYTNPWFDKGTQATLNTPNAFKNVKEVGKLAKFGKGLGAVAKRVPVLSTLLGVGTIMAAPEGQKGQAVGNVGGGLGGSAIGAAIGSVIPGVGTAIGGILGGIAGSIGGGKLGSLVDDNWETIKSKANEAATAVGNAFGTAREKISSTIFNGEWWGEKWDGIKELTTSTIFSAGWWAEQAGFVYGYLESTIFSGEWWSQKWETVKQMTEGTMFDPNWWGEKWESVKSWTAEKWESLQDTWDKTKEAIGNTIFNGAWWGERWNDVKEWTGNAWDSLQVTWDNVTTAIGNTIFNGEWWGARWDDVKGWTASAWDKATDVWESVKTGISNTLFSKDWWSSKWESVKNWASNALSGIGNWVNEKIVQPFAKGREKGQKAAKHANGGLITRPHLGLVGEAGPEMIIPLSPGRRGRAMQLYEETGKMLGVRPYANGGLVGGSVKSPTPQTVQASVNVGSISVQGMDKEAKLYGESFTNAVASGINGNVVPINSWKKNNIENPMQGVIKDALTYGANLVTSFATGQNSKTTGTDVYLSANVHNPFNDTKAKGSGWGSGTIAEFVSGMKSQAAQVKEAAKHLAQQVEKTFREELGIHSPSQVMMKLGEFTSLGIVKGLSKVDVKKFVENQAGSIAAAFAGLASVGGNVQSWLKAAIAITGVPMSWLGPLSIMAQRESGGNPRAINLWDINAKRGTPSKGLMQTIDPTFNAYKMPGMNDIWNPVHNAVAAIRYILARYGTVFNTPGIKSMMRGGPYKGYARGTKGPLPRTEIAWVGEEGPELVKLPKGSEIFPHEESVEMLSGSNKVPAEQMQAIVSPRSGRTAKGKIRDIIVQITGDNHFNGDMDIEKFGDKIVSIIEKALEDEYFEGGEMAIYD